MTDDRAGLEAVADLAGAVAAERSPDAAMAQIVDRLRELLEACECFILVPAPDGHLKIRAARGFPREVIPTITFPPGTSVEGWVAEHREPLFVADVATEPRFVELPERQHPVRAIAALPLLHGDTLLGVLAITRDDPTDWGPRRPLLTVLAELAALALANARALESLRRRAQLDELLADIMALQGDDVGDILQRAADRICSALELDKVDVMLAEDGQLRALGVSRTEMGDRERQAGMDRLALADAGPLATAYLEGRTYRAQRAELEPEPVAAMARRLGVGSILVAPIVVEARRRGLLVLTTSRPHAFGPEDEGFARFLAGRIGLLLRNAELLFGLRTAQEEQARREAREQATAEVLDVLRHDLRSPLTVIVGHLHLLRRAQQWTERTQRSIGIIEQQVRHLQELIDRLGGGEAPLGMLAAKGERFDLVALAREHVKARRGVTPQRQIRLSAEPTSVWIEGDRTALAQLLDNLIGNALRHATTGPIDVEIAADERTAILRVCDRGPGLPLGNRELLFERGRRHGTSAGLGLGLYISRRIAEGHGGRLEASDRPGGGACFTLIVPRPPARAEAAPE